MTQRLFPMPDERLPEFRALVRTQLRELAGSLDGDGFDALFDSTMRDLFVGGLTQTGADEGTVWLLDAGREHLVPRFNSGPRAAEFVGKYRQSLRAGMISMVVATELPICENDLHRNHQQDPTLDRKLGLRTCGMIAVPLYFAGELRGVVSAVCLRTACCDEEQPCGFSAAHLETLQHTAAVLSRLTEHRLLTLCLGTDAIECH